MGDYIKLRQRDNSKILIVDDQRHVVDALIQYLNLETIKAIGFSYGGDVLFQLSLINPSLIESMVTIGAVGSWSTKNSPETVKGFTYENIEKFPWIRDHHKNEI